MAVLWRAVLPIEVRDEREILLATGRFLVDKTGYQQLLTYVRQWPARVWSVEGAKGVGRPLAARLLADGETVWDVPAKLAAGCGFDTGHGRKTDATSLEFAAAVLVRPAEFLHHFVDGDLRGSRQLRDRGSLLLWGRPSWAASHPATNTSAPIRHRLSDFFRWLSGTPVVSDPIARRFRGDCAGP